MKTEQGCHFFAIKHNPNNLDEFKSPDSLEQDFYKPLILTWLSKRYGIEYTHSFRDKFITFSFYWKERISINLDLRDEEQKKLFNALPESIKGTISVSEELVNRDSIYIPLSELFEIKYPTIVDWKYFHTYKDKDNDGDNCYHYTFKVFLSDGTIIYTCTNSNSKPLEDAKKYSQEWVCSDLGLKWSIETRSFLKYILEQDKL